jgi:hypothetical protein
MRRSECSSSSDLGVHDDRNPHLSNEAKSAANMGSPATVEPSIDLVEIE